jgi:hypothetical protein
MKNKEATAPKIFHNTPGIRIWTCAKNVSVIDSNQP